MTSIRPIIAARTASTEVEQSIKQCNDPRSSTWCSRGCISNDTFYVELDTDGHVRFLPSHKHLCL